MTSTTPTYLVGLDLGTRHDYTALSVLQQHILPGSRTAAMLADQYDPVQVSSEHEYAYDLIELSRWRGEGYSVVIPKLRALLPTLRQAGFQQQWDTGRPAQYEPNITILVDHTGVGIAIVEEIRNAGIPCQGITITGGDLITNDGDDWRVPKRELVSRTQVLLETKRLKIASTLPPAATLVAEFDNFRSKKAVLTGHDSYGAGQDWREGNHDDLVLSVAMAAWFGEHHATEDVGLLESHFALENYLRASGHPGYR